jgi:hypothetical protein
MMMSDCSSNRELARLPCMCVCYPPPIIIMILSNMQHNSIRNTYIIILINYYYFDFCHDIKSSISVESMATHTTLMSFRLS